MTTKKKSTTKKKQKGPGRPPGSPNIKRPVQMRESFCCIKCKGTDFRATRAAKVHMKQISFGGKIYGGVINHFVICTNENCKQNQCHRELLPEGEHGEATT